MGGLGLTVGLDQLHEGPDHQAGGEGDGAGGGLHLGVELPRGSIFWKSVLISFARGSIKEFFISSDFLRGYFGSSGQVVDTKTEAGDLGSQDCQEFLAFGAAGTEKELGLTRGVYYVRSPTPGVWKTIQEI